MKPLALQDLGPDVVELVPYVPPPAAAPLREVAFRANVWMPAEIDRLRELFAADATIEEMASGIGRPVAGVSDKLFTLGLRRRCFREWSEFEDVEIVRRYRADPADPAAQIAQDLGRSAGAVYLRAKVLGLSEESAPPWSAWEDAQLRAGYETGVAIPQVAALIGRTLSAVNSRASKLEIRHLHSDPDWSREECARALEIAETGARYLAIIEQLVAEGFPRRTKNGFGQKLRILGYGRGWGRPWSEDEHELLRRAYANGDSLTPLRLAMGRTTCSIRWKVQELGLQGSHINKAGWRTDPPWTPEEDQRLREQYGKAPTKHLVSAFPGRTLGAIYNRANELGLDSGRYRGFSPDEDKAIGIAWRLGVGQVDLGLAMGRDPSIISGRARRLGLSFSDPCRPVTLKGGGKKRPRGLSLQAILDMDPAAEVPVQKFTRLGTPTKGRGRKKAEASPCP